MDMNGNIKILTEKGASLNYIFHFCKLLHYVSAFYSVSLFLKD